MFTNLANELGHHLVHKRPYARIGGELPEPVLSWDSYPILALLLTVEPPYSMAVSGT